MLELDLWRHKWHLPKYTVRGRYNTHCKHFLIILDFELSHKRRIGRLYLYADDTTNEQLELKHAHIGELF